MNAQRPPPSPTPIRARKRTSTTIRERTAGLSLSKLSSLISNSSRGAERYPKPIDNRCDLETVTVDLLKMAFPVGKSVRLLGVSISGFAGDEELGHPRQIALQL
jgi:hypothetical protein